MKKEIFSVTESTNESPFVINVRKSKGLPCVMNAENSLNGVRLKKQKFIRNKHERYSAKSSNLKE